MRLEGVLVAPLVEVDKFAVTFPCPSNCNSPALFEGPLTAWVVSANPLVLNVYEPESVAFEQPAGWVAPLPE